MKLQIKQINPNPYRDMDNYPINREKVEALKASIEQTGFWDNILARPKKGKKFKLPIDGIGDLIIHGEPIVELAYGHHRLTALREVLNPEDTIDIPVKDLSDALMLKIMAKENDNDWETNIAVTDETVRQTRKFLKEYPDEIKTEKPVWSGSPDAGIKGKYLKSPEAFQIAEFLDWSETKVYNSLIRIGMIEEGKIEKEVIEKMPTAKAADRFVSAVKAAEKSENPISVEKQRQTFERLKKEDNFSDRAIRDEITRDSWEQPKKKVADSVRQEKIQKYDAYLIDVRDSVDQCLEHLRKLVRVESELQPEQTAQRALLNMSLKSLHRQIELLIKTNQNEKAESRNTNPASIKG